MAGAGRLVLWAATAAVAGAVVFTGDTFRERWACEVKGRATGVCEQTCAGGRVDAGRGCEVPNADLRCCAPAPASAPDDDPEERGRRLRDVCRNYANERRAKSCPDFRPFNGSNVAYVGEYPYTAALGYDDGKGGFRFQCGGVIISEQFVLTSAVCAKGTRQSGGPKVVRVGDADLTSAEGDAAHVREIAVAEALPHPDYASQSNANDVALLRLADRISFSSDAVQPACVHAERRVPLDALVVAGYGRDERRKMGVLRKADLPLYKGDCKELYKSYKFDIDNDKTLCAGGDGKDTCVGDSGVGLAMKLSAPSCIYSVVAVASFGPAQCGQIPGVYTRLYPYLPWIENIVWPAA